MERSRRLFLDLSWVALGFLLILVGCTTGPQLSQTPEKEKLALTESARGSEQGYPMSPNSTRRASALAHYGMGIIYEQQRQTERALEEFFMAAKLDITNEELVLQVAQKHLQLKKPDQALELLNMASQKPNVSGEVFAWLGITYAQLNRTDQAIKASRMAIRKDPKILLGYQSLAQVYLQKERFKEALQVLDEAARLPDADAAFLVNLAEIYSTFSNLLGKDAAAVKSRTLELLNRALKLDPETLSVRIKMADGFKLLGEMDKAAKTYQDLLEENESLPGLREKLADLFLKQGNLSSAKEQLEFIIRENPLNVQAYYLLGSIASEQKDYAKAAEYFERAILFNPSQISIFIELAAVQIAAEQFQKALETLEKVRLKISQNFAVEFYMGLAFMRMQKYPEALTHYVAAEVIANAKETNRLSPTLFFQLGAAFERNKNYDQAALYFKKCLESSPQNYEAMNYLGYMWAEQGIHLEEAKSLIDKAVAAEPKNAAYLDSLGWVLFKLGRPEEALSYLQQSIEYTEEPDATLWDHLGDVYSALNQPEKADEAWRRSIQIEPNEEIAKKLKSRKPSE